MKYHSIIHPRFAGQINEEAIEKRASRWQDKQNTEVTSHMWENGGMVAPPAQTSRLMFEYKSTQDHNRFGCASSSQKQD